MTDTPDPADPTLACFRRVLGPRSGLDAVAALRFARAAVTPLRVATLDAAGYPHITSLWFLLDAGHFICCTQRNAVLSRNLRRDPRAGFELAVNEPPYRGLSGRAAAHFPATDAATLLTALADRYLGERDPRLRRWLLSRATSEVVIALEPLHLTGWDFSARMSAPARADH
ncbi:MAG: pyridoxamine 5'-phosphate oxidase family protein [Gammaproteobacteria bacterium]